MLYLISLASNLKKYVNLALFDFRNFLLAKTFKITITIK